MTVVLARNVAAADLLDHDRVDAMETDESSGKKAGKESTGGLFTRRLTWWQVLLGLLLAGYLTYAHYQETVAKSESTSQSAPAKAQ